MIPSTGPWWRGLRPWKRHSLVSTVAGLVYVLIGTAYILFPETPARAVSLSVALRWLPMDGWGVIFMFAGTLSMISARWPPISKTWGYMVLTGLSGGWAAAYAGSILIGDAPLTNVTSALAWTLIAFLWWAISGLYNRDDARLFSHGPG